MKKILLVPFLFLLTLMSCRGERVEKHIIRGFAQGTTYNIVYLDSHQSVNKSDIANILNDFDLSCSLYKETSLLNKINSRESCVMDENIKNCINLSLQISKESDGIYDITVKPLIEAYGFAAKNGLKHVNVDSLIQFVGYEKIKISGDTISLPKGVEIDLNSIAQGYSVDIVSRFFDEKGIENYLVEIGGEIFCRGKNFSGDNWRIGIDKPIDGNINPGENMQTTIPLESGRGLATSGNYRKFHYDENGERVNHTINPHTGKSATTNLLSSTIIASSAALADGYATMSIAMGAERAIKFFKKHPEIGVYIVYSVGENNLVYEQ